MRFGKLRNTMEIVNSAYINALPALALSQL
jgi:hypothetical protein